MVSAPTGIAGLYHSLVNPADERILFNINRGSGIDSLMTRDPLHPHLKQGAMAFLN